MSAPKHDWAVGDRAEVIGHQTQAQGTVVKLSTGRYPIAVRFPGIDFTYWYAPGQLKFLGRDTLSPYPDSITIQNPRPENPKALPRHEQVIALHDTSKVGLVGRLITENVSQLSLASADHFLDALHRAGYELVKK